MADEEGHNDIVLSFRSVAGEAFEAVLHSVSDFRCDNFRQGNIVFEMIEVPPREVSRREIEHLKQIGPEDFPEHMEQVLLSIETGEYKFIRLGSSYGAVLCALCRSMEIRPVP
ncbi:MAG: hypothetical protein O3C34_06030 [Proteobacteria bacterium]|nr:hypothetical protein [Pseudomonadota bacterium]